MKKIIFLMISFFFVLFFISCENSTDTRSSRSCGKEFEIKCHDGDLYLFNMCEDMIGIITECGESEKCEIDKCVPCKASKECFEKKCYDGDVFCFNDCGKRTVISKECEEGTTCSDGKCVECVPTDECALKKCFDGNVFCYNDCGGKGELDEVCAQSESCDNGKCIECEVTDECKTKKCIDSEIYCFNNCGKEGDLFKKCASYEICEDNECKCTPDCNGKECGDNGCGGTCGTCPGSSACFDGKCDTPLDLEGPEYTGNVLLIVNTGTNGNQTSFTGTINATVLKDHVSDNGSGIPMMRKYFDPGVRIPEDLDMSVRPQRIKKLASSVIVNPVAGDIENFWVADFSSGNNRNISATLQHTTSKCEVWAESTSATSKSRAIEICNDFDSVIYPMVTTNFHAESDVNGDGKIAFLIANLGGFAAGYFSPADFYTKQQYSQSNARDIIYIEQSMTTYQITNTIAHEFQHLCYGNRNFLIENDQNYGDLSQRWIDEGLATASEHFYGGTQNDWISVFNTKPYNDPVADGNGFFKWDYSDYDRVYSDYALTYAFFQYLRLQAQNKDGIYKEIILNTKNNWTGVEDTIKSRISPTMNFSDFIINFRVAMLLNKLDGTYGFMSEPGMKFTPRYYTGTGKNLEGGGALYVQINGSFTDPGNKGSGIVYIGIKTK